MSIKDRFLAYADDFEKSYVDDDWSRIGQYFTEDAVYDGDTPAGGRSAVLTKLKAGVDNLDRRMDSRAPSFQPLTVSGNTVIMQWTVVYTKKGLPNLVISGKETAVFNGERIASLRDEFDPGVQQVFGDWMTKHAAALAG